jgi:hypothetical protein
MHNGKIIRQHGLAKDWDDKLSTQRPRQEEYARFVHGQPWLWSRAEREAIAP